MSNLEVNKKENVYFEKQFNETIKVIGELDRLDTSKVNPTYHVTGLNNVFREDLVDESRILKQEDVLSSAKSEYKGYFLIKALFNDR